MMLQTSVLKRCLSNLSLVKTISSSMSRQFCSDKKLEDVPLTKLLDESTTFVDLKNKEWSTSPYDEEVAKKQLEKEDPKKPKLEPSNFSVMMFPGQGLIQVGQVEKYLKFPRVREMFEIANEILGYNLLRMCREGPMKLLYQTEFNQPATVLMSLAALEALNEERPDAVESCIAAIGYSVGELAALIFSGAMTFEEGIKLVSVRGTAMQSAADLVPQGMVSAFVTYRGKASTICTQAQNWALDIGAKDPVCAISIYVYPEFKIFGGCNEALEYIKKNSDSLGIRKLKRLPVKGAFHTPLMEAACAPFNKALQKIEFMEPNVHVYSNWTAETYKDDVKGTRKNLTKQLVKPVKWEQILHSIYKRDPTVRFPRTFDLGSNGAMRTILERVNGRAAEFCHVY